MPSVIKISFLQGVANSTASLLGKLLRDGQCIRHDAEAVKWDRKAADQGHAVAEHNLTCAIYKPKMKT